MVLQLLQTPDRRQIFRHLRDCRKGCGVTESVPIFASLLCFCADSECAIFTAVPFLKRGTEGGCCRGTPGK